MEQKTKHRYEIIAEALGYDSIRLFETEIRVAESSIAQAIRRKSKVSRNNADKIKTRFPQVNRDWLLTGRGTMFVSSTDTNDETHLAEGATGYSPPAPGADFISTITHLFKMIPEDLRVPEAHRLLGQMIADEKKRNEEKRLLLEELRQKNKKT